MRSSVGRRPEVRERLRQFAADINDLNRHEGSDAKPTTQTELSGLPLATLLAWSRDIERRRLEAGLPANVGI